MDTLVFPYAWESRTPTIAAEVFFIPPYYGDYGSFSLPEWPNLFGNENPIKLEFCSGNGSWIVDKCTQDKSVNWIAVEKRFDRVQQIWQKARRLGVRNLFIVCGEAFTFSSHYLSSESIEEIFINFPDPWPKTRHAKHRLITPHFIEELARIVKKEGGVAVATDDPRTSHTTRSLFLSGRAFQSTFPFPYYVTEWPEYGSSYFESLWKQMGKTLFYHRFSACKKSSSL